jgi:hypothetical protein
VAHFTAPHGAKFIASIGWGNGHWTDGAITPGSGGGFDVIGSATYAAAGSYPITVQLDGPDGTKATGTGLATVTDSAGQVSPADAPLEPAPAPDDAPPPAPPAGAETYQGPARAPADGGGSVPWGREPDPSPRAPGRAAAPLWLHDPGGATPDAAPAEAAEAAPAYLAANGPAPADPPVVPASLMPLALRPVPPVAGLAVPVVDDPLAVWSPVPVMADAPGTGRAASAGAEPAADAGGEARWSLAAARVAGAAGDSSEGAGRKRRPPVAWWRTLSWGLALILSERVLAARWADRAAPAAGLRRPAPDEP